MSNFIKTVSEAHLHRPPTVRLMFSEPDWGFRPLPELRYLNPVRVVAGTKHLGWANVRRSGWDDTLVADMVIDAACPERLSLETGSQKLYARLSGAFSLRREPYSLLGVLTEAVDLADVEAVDIEEIDIGSEPAYRSQEPIGVAPQDDQE